MTTSHTPHLIISEAAQRRFVLGKQGLFPGRRWQGKEGVVQALHEGAVVQVDPLNVVARSHDIVLYSRVRDYQPSDLDTALYTNRALFDYGGTVMIHRMEELPCWRIVMARKGREPRRLPFAREYRDVINSTLETIRARGPLGTRDFKGAAARPGNFRSGKVTGQALYYLWLAGELMTHSRRGFERIYDLRERIAPPDLNHAASEEEADAHFETTPFRDLGIITERSWRASYAGTIERPVSKDEAAARLGALLTAGKITPIGLEGDTDRPRYILSADLPLLETLHAGDVPQGRCPPATDAERPEMVFLAPLEIVSARGRAGVLFGFDYLWEVYKPAEKRRWGYYTLPVLYGDRLVARLDPKLDRTTGELLVKGFWLEEGVTVDHSFISAFGAAIIRFISFIKADTADLSALQPERLREGVRALVRSR